MFGQFRAPQTVASAGSGATLGDQEPEHDHQGDKQEEAGQELFVHILGSPWNSWGRPAVVYVECRCKYTERKCPNSKRHLEAAITEPEALEAPSVFRLRPLSLRSWWCFLSGILLSSAAPAVQRDHFVAADSGFADGTHLPVGPGLQPLV